MGVSPVHFFNPKTEQTPPPHQALFPSPVINQGRVRARNQTWKEWNFHTESPTHPFTASPP